VKIAVDDNGIWIFGLQLLYIASGVPSI